MENLLLLFIRDTEKFRNFGLGRRAGTKTPCAEILCSLLVSMHTILRNRRCSLLLVLFILFINAANSGNKRILIDLMDIPRKKMQLLLDLSATEPGACLTFSWD
jgi:hypothetical protein